MITVAILINGQPLTARSATRISGKKNCTYKLDDGSVIHHKYSDGAVVLAIKMLKTIKVN